MGMFADLFRNALQEELKKDGFDVELGGASEDFEFADKPTEDDEKPNQDDEKPNQDDEKPNQDDEKPNQYVEKTVSSMRKVIREELARSINRQPAVETPTYEVEDSIAIITGLKPNKEG